jgi:hypothetical protein
VAHRSACAASGARRRRLAEGDLREVDRALGLMLGLLRADLDARRGRA